MNQNKIASFIKKIRLENKLTQQEFADKYGVTYQAVSKWENAKNLPDISILKEICNDYNIDLNELLDVSKTKNVNKKKYIILGIVIVVLLLGLFLYFYLRKDNDFNFKKITTTCDNFTLYGTIAYNNNKTSLYISNISHCEDNDILYKNIKCTLYEKNNDIKKQIASYSYDKNIKLNDFLKTIDFNIEHYSKSCNMYKDNALELEIEAEKELGKMDYYKIPLKIENC